MNSRKRACQCPYWMRRDLGSRLPGLKWSRNRQERLWGTCVYKKRKDDAPHVDSAKTTDVDNESLLSSARWMCRARTYREHQQLVTLLRERSTHFPGSKRHGS